MKILVLLFRTFIIFRMMLNRYFIPFFLFLSICAKNYSLCLFIRMLSLRIRNLWPLSQCSLGWVIFGGKQIRAVTQISEREIGKIFLKENNILDGIFCPKMHIRQKQTGTRWTFFRFKLFFFFLFMDLCTFAPCDPWTLRPFSLGR